MTYKRKIAVLSALVAVLAIIYILILVSSSPNRRSDAFAWLDPSLVVMADGIDIYGQEGGILLSRKNNVWGIDSGFPIKQSRVEDLLALLTRRNIYPQRAASQEAIQRLGLMDESASRIRVRGGAGLPLLDLLVGSEDVMGRDVYLRRADRNQIYSGEDQFTSFTNSKQISWYDLRLFRVFSIDSVQQAEIRSPGSDAYILRRSGSGWVMPGKDDAIDSLRVEAWLRAVIEAEGQDFSTSPLDDIEGSVTLWLADGTVKKIETGSADEEGNRQVSVSDSSFIYSFNMRGVGRLFPRSPGFIKTES